MMADLQTAFESPRGYPKRPANAVGLASVGGFNLCVDVFFEEGKYFIRRDDKLIPLPDDIRDQAVSGHVSYKGYRITFDVPTGKNNR